LGDLLVTSRRWRKGTRKEQKKIDSNKKKNKKKKEQKSHIFYAYALFSIIFVVARLSC